MKLLFIGSYSEADATGVHVAAFDEATGAVALRGGAAGLKNPTFLQVDALRRKLYAITEAEGPDGAKRGAAAAYDIDAEGGLSPLNVEETVPAPTCHIELDAERGIALVSSYHGGLLGLSPIERDGRIGPASDVKRHEGRSALPVQDRPRVHSATFDRARRYAVVCDLGLDRIFTYRVDAEAGRLVSVADVAVAPGAGPRHFAFHPSLPFGYVINELNATIDAFRYDEERGTLTPIQTVPTLPSDYAGPNACADIHLSPDGKFLYGSNRGHDSIAVYAVSERGELSLVEHASTLGEHPRNFALSPNGAFLLAANRDTNDVVVFSRDARTGQLTPTEHRVNVPKPVCLKFL